MEQKNELMRLVAELKTIMGNLEEIFDEQLNSPLKRSDIMLYLNRLQTYSPAMLGGMEVQAMKDQYAKEFSGEEVHRLGETIKHTIVTIREDQFEEFCEAFNEAWIKQPHANQWLSIGRVFNAARTYADGGVINLLNLDPDE